MLLAALLVVIITTFQLVPIMETISSGFMSDGEISSYWFARVITNPIVMSELGNTLLLAVIRTKYEFLGMNVLGVLLLIPLILPPSSGRSP